MEVKRHGFWLITTWSEEQMDAEALLELYRERGTAKGYYGELKSVLDPALSSSPRQKSHCRGALPEKRTVAGDAFAQNEVILLLNALAYNVAHAARVLMETASREGWSLMRLRERVLRVAARVLVHGRRATLVIGKAPVKLWRALVLSRDLALRRGLTTFIAAITPALPTIWRTVNRADSGML